MAVPSVTLAVPTPEADAWPQVRRLALKLANHDIDHDELLALTHRAFLRDATLLGAASADLEAVKDRDPSNTEILTPFLYFKGFLALQAHRVAHWLWSAAGRIWPAISGAGSRRSSGSTSIRRP